MGLESLPLAALLESVPWGHGAMRERVGRICGRRYTTPQAGPWRGIQDSFSTTQEPRHTKYEREHRWNCCEYQGSPYFDRTTRLRGPLTRRGGASGVSSAHIALRRDLFSTIFFVRSPINMISFCLYLWPVGSLRWASSRPSTFGAPQFARRGTDPEHESLAPLYEIEVNFFVVYDWARKK